MANQTLPTRTNNTLRSVLVIAAGYAAVASLWILASDSLLAWVFRSPARISAFQTYKGLGYVLVTALVLAVLLHHQFRQREQTEQALRQSEERFRAISTLTPDHILMQDSQLRYMFVVNPQLGLAEQDMLGKTDRDLLSPEEADQLTRIKTQVLETGEPFHLETSLISQDGSRETFDGTYVPKVNAQGQIDGLIGYFRNVTERALAEEALRKSEERFRRAMDNIPDVVVIYSPDLRIQYINAATRRLTGRATSEFIGRREEEIWPPEVYEVYLPTLKEALRTREPHSLETDLELPGSGMRSLSITCVPLLDEEGAVREVLGITHDRTERKLAEMALRESEEKYRLLVDHSPYAIGVHQDGKLVFVNQSALSLFGARSAAQLIGKPVSDFVHPPQLAAARDRIERLMKGETGLYPVEDRYVRLDGSDVPVEVTAAPLTYQGRPAIQVIALDITERKRAEEALRRYADRLEVLHEIDRGIIAAHTLDEIANRVLPHVRRVFACQRSDLGLFDGSLTAVTAYAADYEGESVILSNTTYPLSPSKQLERLKNGQLLLVPDFQALEEDPSALTGLLLKEGYRSGLFAPLMLDGQLYGVFGLLAAAPDHFNAEHGEVAEEIASQLVIAVRQVQMMEQIAQHAQELEQRVAERTAQLEAKNRELEAFTYSVSHDLKAPLRGIDGYSRLLLSDYVDRLDDEGQAFLHNIEQAALQMHQLIDDLLAYSHLERRPLQASQVDPQALAESVLAERAGEIEARGIATTVEVPCATITADPEGMAMALRNLLDNALKFTRDVPHPVVEIGGRDTGTTCVLWVRDNGIGFDMKFHDRIFDIFQRLHRVEDYPGTGIGLAIVRKVMERIGGRTWAESEPGRGAAFYLEIPR